jgi:glutaredoxin
MRGLGIRLWRWLQSCRADPPVAIVYTRAGCHLCEDAVQILRGHGLAVTLVDVDADPDLARRHGERVPVVVIGGRERFFGRVNPVLLARILRAERPGA